MHQPNPRDRLSILLAALLFSTGGVVIKSTSLGGLEVAGLRALVATIAVVLLVPGPVVLARRAVVLTGVAQGAAMLLFVLANKMTTAANTIFLQSAAPLFIPFLASRVLGEKATKRDLVAMVGIGVGLSLFFVGGEQPTATAPQPRLGDLLAIASGIAWACTVIGLRYLSRAEGGPRVALVEAGVEAALTDGGAGEPLDVAGSPAAARVGQDRDVSGATASHRASGAAKGALVWGNVFVALVALPGVLPLATVTTWDAVALVYLGVAQVALAYRFLVRGVENVPALEASLLILFEPVLNPLWAFLFLAEVPGPMALAGAGIIATVTVARALAGSRP